MDIATVDELLSTTRAVRKRLDFKRPVPIGEWEGRGALWTFNGNSRWVPYCAAFNHTGQPAASVPAGLTADGFPTAAQLVGRPDDEQTLF